MVRVPLWCFGSKTMTSEFKARQNWFAKLFDVIQEAESTFEVVHSLSASTISCHKDTNHCLVTKQLFYINSIAYSTINVLI